MSQDTPARPYEDAYLWTPADRARLAELQEALNSAIARASEMSDAPVTMDEESPSEPARVAARELDEFVTEAKERARVVRMVALPRKPWRALKDKHPIRMVETKEKGEDGEEVVTEDPHPVDRLRGFNVETMGDDLVTESVEFDGNNAARDAFLDALSEPDFNTLYVAALTVNVGAFTPPKAEYSSHVDRIIAEISSSQDPSD